MNLQHLKYALEVERAKSISKAAEALYVSQPFLSKAIRELECHMGFDIFNRTSRGVLPTRRGAEFLAHASQILAHVEEVESLYKVKPQQEYRFEITVPIACYIAHAFVAFVKELSDKERLRVDYLEANTMTAIDRVADHDSSLGIIRYETRYEDYFLRYVESKELIMKPLWEFSYRLILSQNSPLAGKERVEPEDLEELIEISHGDPTVPSLPVSAMLENRRKGAGKREIVVYERQSQFGLLCAIPETYMWASPTPREVLEGYPLVQKKCGGPDNRYKDVLIYRKGYRLTGEDRLFLEKVRAETRRLEG